MTVELSFGNPKIAGYEYPKPFLQQYTTAAPTIIATLVVSKYV
jgi:hypothetical protein